MKTSKIIIVLIVLSGLVLIGALGIGLYTSNDIKIRTDQMNQINNGNIEYHVMMILKGSDETYSQSFFDAVKSEAKDKRIAVETILIDDDNFMHEVIDRLDMAIYAKVDGIILHAYDDAGIIDKINQASEMGIPVVTLNENLHQSKRISYAGNNRYSIGINVGKTIAELNTGRGQIAIVDRINYKPDVFEVSDLLQLGVSDVFKSYEKLDISFIKHTEQGVLSAETIATEILEEYPEVDGIYCSDGQSTLGIVQVLIDRNRVSDFTVIGYGDDPEILQYIKSGVIDATIVTDNPAVGVAAINTFYAYMESGITNSEFLPSLMVVNKLNVDAYIKKEMESNDEE